MRPTISAFGLPDEERERNAARAAVFKLEQEERIREAARKRARLLLPLASAYSNGLLAFWIVQEPKRAARAILVERPQLHIEDGALHRWDAPAVEWANGTGYWYWQGVRIWREIAEHPGRLTARYIASTRNVERRRVLLERLGYPRFLETAGAELVNHDDYGKLWSTDIEIDDEAVTVVEVVNSTAEPDGTFRRYFLRVPPGSRSARQAVAWTFGFDNPQAYELALQT